MFLRFDFSDVVRQLSESIDTPLLTYNMIPIFEYDNVVASDGIHKTTTIAYSKPVKGSLTRLTDTPLFHTEPNVCVPKHIPTRSGGAFVLVVVFGDSLGVSNGYILRAWF